jgi:hypothetical protein
MGATLGDLPAPPLIIVSKVREEEYGRRKRYLISNRLMGT